MRVGMTIGTLVLAACTSTPGSDDGLEDRRAAIDAVVLAADQAEDRFDDAAPGEAFGSLGDYTGADATGMAIIGRWVSMDDPRAGLDIDLGRDGHEARSTYDREGTAEPLTFVTDCENRSRADARSRVFTIGMGENALCYALDRLTLETMVLTYLPRGNRLVFERTGHE